MEFKHIVLISLLTTLSEVRSKYNISTEKYVWDSATNVCTLATPTIHFSGDNLSVDLPVNLDDDVWIGYYRNTTVFEYTGCVLTSDLHYTNIRINTPGNCLSSCGTRYLLIGLSNNKCYCLNQEIGQSSQDCGVECTAMKGVACGSNTSISLYKVVDSGVSSGGKEDCLQMEKTPDALKFTWLPCDAYLRIVCTLANKTVIAIGEINFQWYRVSKTCFEIDAAPTTLNNSMKINHTQAPSWTGVLRSTAIYRYSPFELPNTDYQAFGYLDVNKNINFDFAKKKKRILCFKNGATALPGSTNPTEAHTSMQSGVGVTVGVSVAVIVIIASAVTVLVVIKRRKVKTPNNDVDIKKSNRNEDGTNDYTEIPEIKHANDNIPLRYSKTEAPEKYAHPYHVLEKDQKTDNKNDTKLNKDPKTDSHYNYPDMTGFIQDKINDQSADLGHGQYAHTYFVLEGHQKDVDSADGTYNVTGAHNPKVVQETDNVYNKLDENYHATYDHLRKHEAKKQGSDEIYDRKENAIRVPKPGGEPDNVYNLVPAVEESGTYDHVNVSSDAKWAVKDCGV